MKISPVICFVSFCWRRLTSSGQRLVGRREDRAERHREFQFHARQLETHLTREEAAEQQPGHASSRRWLSVCASAGGGTRSVSTVHSPHEAPPPSDSPAAGPRGARPTCANMCVLRLIASPNSSAGRNAYSSRWPSMLAHMSRLYRVLLRSATPLLSRSATASRAPCLRPSATVNGTHAARRRARARRGAIAIAASRKKSARSVVACFGVVALRGAGRAGGSKAARCSARGATTCASTA